MRVIKYIIEIEWFPFNMAYIDDCSVPHDLFSNSKSSKKKKKKWLQRITKFIYKFILHSIKANFYWGKAMEIFQKKNRRYNVELC